MTSIERYLQLFSQLELTIEVT